MYPWRGETFNVRAKRGERARRRKNECCAPQLRHEKAKKSAKVKPPEVQANVCCVVAGVHRDSGRRFQKILERHQLAGGTDSRYKQ